MPLQGGLFATFCEKIGDPLKKKCFTPRGSIIFPPKVAKRPPFASTYCGWTESCTTLKPWLKPLFVGIYVGESNHSLGLKFLNGGA